MEKEYLYKVCTRCFTYNHAEFIKSALDGFVLQRTNFSVVYVIVDDGSTDGTADVIKNYIIEHFDFNSPDSYQRDEDYGQVYFAPHQKKENCFFAVILLKENHYRKKSKNPYFEKWYDNAKYHAVCEGDDYWIDENKLQKQVEFLEQNPEYSLTCHRYKIYDFENDKWGSDNLDAVFQKNPNGITFDYEYKEAWLPKTLSLVYRNSATDEYRRLKGGRDSVFVYLIMKHGPAFCFNEVWGVYRKSKKGIYSKQTLYHNKVEEYKAMKKLYEFDPNRITRKEYYDNYAAVLFMGKGKILFQEKFEFRKILSAFYYAVLKVFRYIKFRGENGKYRFNGLD